MSAASAASRGIGVRDRHPLEAAIAEHVDHAPVGEVGHRELRHAPERLLVVERARQATRLASASSRSVDSTCLRSVMSSTTLIARVTAPPASRTGCALTRIQRTAPVARIR